MFESGSEAICAYGAIAILEVGLVMFLEWLGAL